MRLAGFLFCTCLLLNVSCKHQQTNDASNVSSNAEAQHSHEKDSLGIEFNNGEKWKVDSNMLIHIRKMENDVLAFGNTKQKEYASLSSELHIQIDSLTSNCTMTGQAHDELHKWLLPYIDLVDELSESKNESEAENRFHDIQHSFNTFNKYFQ